MVFKIKNEETKRICKVMSAVAENNSLVNITFGIADAEGNASNMGQLQINTATKQMIETFAYETDKPETIVKVFNQAQLNKILTAVASIGEEIMCQIGDTAIGITTVTGKCKLSVPYSSEEFKGGSLGNAAPILAGVVNPGDFCEAISLGGYLTSGKDSDALTICFNASTKELEILSTSDAAISHSKVAINVNVDGMPTEAFEKNRTDACTDGSNDKDLYRIKIPYGAVSAITGYVNSSKTLLVLADLAHIHFKTDKGVLTVCLSANNMDVLKVYKKGCEGGLVTNIQIDTGELQNALSIIGVANEQDKAKPIKMSIDKKGVTFETVQGAAIIAKAIAFSGTEQVFFADSVKLRSLIKSKGNTCIRFYEHPGYPVSCILIGAGSLDEEFNVSALLAGVKADNFKATEKKSDKKEEKTDDVTDIPADDEDADEE